MNHIHALQYQIAALRAERNKTAQQLTELRQYLESAKFQGPDNNWVNPQDVLSRLPIIYAEEPR